MTFYKILLEDVIHQIKPHHFVENVLRVNGNRLSVGDRSYDLNNNVSVIGFGKATLGMFTPVKRILGSHVTRAFLSVPHTTPDHMVERLACPGTCIVRAAQHNLPDDNAVNFTRTIVEHARTLNKEDLCLCLISGGGSALLCDPVVPLRDLLATIQLMVSHSATIQQLNVLRSYMSRVKGGGLAQIVSPAPLLSLIISDVIGDPLHAIASGPTVPNQISAADVMEVLSSIQLETSSLPSTVKHLLKSNHSINTLSALNSQPFNKIVASNQIAMEVAAGEVEKAGYKSYILTNALSGDAAQVGKDLVAALTEYPTHTEPWLLKIREILDVGVQGKICFILGGETTVRIKGEGVGGRCQEMALAAVKPLSMLGKRNLSPGCKGGVPPACKGGVSPGCSVTLVVTSTDGQDGPTDASGAIVKEETADQAVDQGLDPDHYLLNNDSYTFFSKLNGGANLLKSGVTGTNLMDIVFIFVESSENFKLDYLFSQN